MQKAKRYIRCSKKFGTKGDKALFQILVILGISNSRHFLSVFICVHLRPISLLRFFHSAIRTPNSAFERTIDFSPGIKF